MKEIPFRSCQISQRVTHFYATTQLKCEQLSVELILCL